MYGDGPDKLRKYSKLGDRKKMPKIPTIVNRFAKHTWTTKMTIWRPIISYDLLVALCGFIIFNTEKYFDIIEM